jgi:hypothetical protein
MTLLLCRPEELEVRHSFISPPSSNSYAPRALRFKSYLTSRNYSSMTMLLFRHALFTIGTHFISFLAAIDPTTLLLSHFLPVAAPVPTATTLRAFLFLKSFGQFSFFPFQPVFPDNYVSSSAGCCYDDLDEPKRTLILMMARKHQSAR